MNVCHVISSIDKNSGGTSVYEQLLVNELVRAVVVVKGLVDGACSSVVSCLEHAINNIALTRTTEIKSCFIFLIHRSNVQL